MSFDMYPASKKLVLQINKYAEYADTLILKVK